MKTLGQIITESIESGSGTVMWFAIPSGIIHGKISVDEDHKPNEAAFWLEDAKFLHFQKDNSHLEVGRARVLYNGIWAWGFDEDLPAIA